MSWVTLEFESGRLASVNLDQVQFWYCNGRTPDGRYVVKVWFAGEEYATEYYAIREDIDSLLSITSGPKRPRMSLIVGEVG